MAIPKRGSRGPAHLAAAIAAIFLNPLAVAHAAVEEFVPPAADEQPAGTAAAESAQPNAGESVDLASRVQPPVLVAESAAPYPAELKATPRGGTVRLELTLDESGAVSEAKVLEGAHPLLDAAALDASRRLRFEPASIDGVPIAVRIQYHYVFEAPVIVPVPAMPMGMVTGEIRSRGNRRAVPGAFLVVDGERAMSDADGRFRMTLPVGRQRVVVKAPGFRDSVFNEEIAEGEALEVRYALEPLLLNPYETIVRAERDRTEVARVALSRQEIREVPGTMGDPFRVVMLLPGVGSMASGVAYPVVRGAAPASTGYFLDGVRVPMLFHLYLGPAVIHPDFIEGLDFYGGAPPTRFGRLLGGIVDGKASRSRDELHASAYLDVINAGGFVEVPIKQTKTNVALAGRYSYSPWLLAMAANSSDRFTRDGERVVLDFWDYQGRVEQAIGAGKLRLFAFGSSDHAGTTSENPEVTAANQSVQFHRIDARYQHAFSGDSRLELAVTRGFDEFAYLSQATAWASNRIEVFEDNWNVRSSLSKPLGHGFTLGVGGDFERRQAHLEIHAVAPPGYIPEHLDVMQPPFIGAFGGVWSELTWKSPSESWILAPGMRFDSYHLVPGISHLSAEPRMTARYKLFDPFTLKAAAGLYHQQPTAVFEMPIVHLASLRYGLQEAAQFDAGFEWQLGGVAELVVDAYYNPLMRTIEFNPFDQEAISLSNLDQYPVTEIGSELPSVEDILPPSQLTSHGRAYGLELLLRRPLGGRWFGWLGYTLQRSTRYTSYTRFNDQGVPIDRQSGYLPYTYDQTHIVNAVLSYKIGTWTFGAAGHFNTGRPENGVMTSSAMRQGVDQAGNASWVRLDENRSPRLPPFFRLDLRAAKSWAFQNFMLDAYLDLMNATLTPETIGFSYVGGGGRPLKRIARGLPVTLPILGVKATY